MSTRVGEPKVQVRCPGCGGRRDVTARTRQRIRVGELTGECSLCRRFKPSEAGMRWWLHRFGDNIPVGVPVAAHVQSHGLPSGLQELVASISKPPKR